LDFFLAERLHMFTRGETRIKKPGSNSRAFFNGVCKV
jgi:hypothetical protein